MAISQKLGQVLGKALEPVEKAAATGYRQVVKRVMPSAEVASSEVIRGSMHRGGEELGGSLKLLAQRAWVSGMGLLDGMGPEGQQLKNMMLEVDKRYRLRAGLDRVRVNKLTEGLSKSDVEKHIYEVMAAETGALGPKQQGAADGIRKIFDEYGNDALEQGLDEMSGPKYKYWLDKYKAEGMGFQEAARAAMKKARRPFTPMDNYVPRYFSETSIQKYMSPGKDREDALARIAAQYGTNRRGSETILEAMIKAPGEFRGGALQHTRSAPWLTGYDKNIRRISHRYIDQGALRLEMSRMFGARDHVAMDLLQKIASRVGPERAKLANNLYLAMAGQLEDTAARRLAKQINPLFAVSMLSTAGIVQPSQMTNTIARSSWVSAYKGASEIIRNWKKSKEWTESTGATVASVSQDLQIDSINDLSSVWARMIGLEHLDRINRVHAAITGRFEAERLAKILRSGNAKAEANAARWFVDMGLDPAAIAARGILTPDEYRTAGLMFSNETQFATRALDMPELRTTNAGPFLFLFRSFAYQQARFIKKMVWEEGRVHGNWAPLLRYGSAISTVAPLMGEIVRAARGKERPENFYLRVAEDAVTAGALGGFWDMAKAMDAGPGPIMAYFMGPAAGEVSQALGSDIPALAKSIPGALTEGEDLNTRPLVKHIVRRTPLIGQYMANVWMADE